MQKDLVTVLTPCYNGGQLIHRLLNSLLQQDYPYIEIIVVDDGSTDNTRDVVTSYKDKFNKKGYSFKYIYQENGGQSSAINNGLKYVHGEYLVWPDCDDWYNTAIAISTFVKELKHLSEEYAEVRCLPTCINEKTFLPKCPPIFKEEYLDPQQFNQCLFAKGFIWPPGNYMLRMDKFDKVNPEREIYVEKDAGQNWQMHLPVLYSYKVHTIPKSFHNVLVRSESHSRGQYRTYLQKIARVKAYENTVIGTLDRINEMSAYERLKYLRKLTAKYNYTRFLLALSYRQYKDAVAYRTNTNKKDLQINGFINKIVFKVGGCLAILFVINELLLLLKFADRVVRFVSNRTANVFSWFLPIISVKR